ncbi:MAG: putative quinol monooxygenase [Dehalococcoidia bacterium]|nr:putative quinol monooxygenase [Dehalococcoidia bacterium]
MFIVKAIFPIEKGKEQEAEAAFKAMMPKVQSEPGTLEYTLHRGEKNPSRFFVYEKYTDRKAFEAHTATPHFQELSKKLSGMADGAPDLEFFEQISAIKPK